MSDPSKTPLGTPAARPVVGARTLAAALTGLESLALFGIVVYYAVELSRGEGSEPVRVVTEGLLILVVAVGLALLTRGWLRWTRWPRTPTLVWNALLVPVGIQLLGAGLTAVGAAVLVAAVASVVLALVAPRPADDEGEVDAV